MRRVTVAVLGSCLAVQSAAHASLIAYYNFDDPADGGKAQAGTDATLGSNASITQNVADIAVGTGGLQLGTPSSETSNGAVSGNNFSWTASDIRTVAFWMKGSSQSDTNPTMISLGSGASAGNRFDIRLAGTALRFEVQSGGSTVSGGPNMIDGAWRFVSVVVPVNPATVADTKYYIYDSSATLLASGTFTGSTTAIATGDGPLRIGDSYQDTARDFIGFIDEVRLYDTALSEQDVAALAAQFNPVPEPSTWMVVGVTAAAGAVHVGRRRSRGSSKR
jgi:hypothetical protein